MIDSIYTSLEDVAATGKDFQVFVTSNVGKYLLFVAEKEEIEVLRKLAKVAADDTQAILKLQVQAEVPRRLLQFIDNALKTGKVAEFQLNQAVED